MTMPTQEAQRSRETAMQAERHWFVVRLKWLAESWRVEAAWQCEHVSDRTGPLTASVYRQAANQLDRLIAERTK